MENFKNAFQEFLIERVCAIEDSMINEGSEYRRIADEINKLTHEIKKTSTRRIQKSCV